MVRRSALTRFLPARLAVGLFVCLAAAAPAGAQLVLGQYEDEAPLGSWNVFGAVGARALGSGGIRVARAWDGSVSMTNPALLLSLPRVSAGLTASYSAASLFRYSLVNTGVLSSMSNLFVGVLALETGTFAHRFGEWAVAFTTGLIETYSRPQISWSYPYVYALTMRQSGSLRAYNLAAARRLGRRFSLGLGFNVVDGRLDRTVTEEWPEDGITITDEKSERFRGAFVNAGLRADLSPRVAVSLAVRTPCLRTSAGQSLLRYEARDAGTDIRIEAEARNEYRQPWVAGAGVDWRLSEAWSVAADLVYFGWSRYSVVYFEEPAARSFRDVVTAAAGIEYGIKGRLGGRPVRFPVRVGVTYDPQPMDDVHSRYLALTFGLGLRPGAFAIDLGGSIGREAGSGNSLRAGRIALSVGYALDAR
jgi:hypothetical protein